MTCGWRRRQGREPGATLGGMTIRKLAALAPTTLALMHGSSFDGDCQEALIALADGYEARLLDAMD